MALRRKLLVLVGVSSLCVVCRKQKYTDFEKCVLSSSKNGLCELWVNRIPSLERETESKPHFRGSSQREFEFSVQSSKTSSWSCTVYGRRWSMSLSSRAFPCFADVTQECDELTPLKFRMEPQSVDARKLDRPDVVIKGDVVRENSL